MEAEQIALPFRLLTGRSVKGRDSNADLIGQSFFDRSEIITVIGVCPLNPKQVMVQRDFDGKSWAVPAGVVRLIVGNKKRRRAA